MGEEKKKAETKAAVVGIEIAFREVNAIFDTNGGRRVVGTPDKPLVVYEVPNVFGAYARKYDPKFEDDFGNKVREVKSDMPGVYQPVRITGYAPAFRTFSRKLVEKIDNKFVYVFESSNKGGSDMKLLAELHFKGGEFQLVDLKANAEKDARPASGDKRSKLIVTAKSITMSKGPFLWFLLAPHQIPWAGLQNMVKSGNKLASRCQRLFDEFYTDGVVSGGEPKTIWELQDDIKAGKPIGFMMYLIDPIKEGLRRADLYATWVSNWQELQKLLGSDSEYVLAKRIHNLPQEYVDVVWHRLGPYLAEKEKLVRVMLRVASQRLEDLMCWIGEQHQRDNWSTGKVSSDTWWFKGDGTGGVSLERKEDRAWVNPFSEMVGDFNHATTSEDAYKKIGEAVAAVHARLGDLPRGQDFLKKMVNEAFRGAMPNADGGAKLLFEAGRKGDAAAAEVVGSLLEFYAPKWVEAYRSNALPELVKFMREKHKIELKQIKPRSVRRAEEALARRAHKAASKKGIEKLAAHYHLELEPGSVRGLKMSSAALNRLMLGIEVFNMKYSIMELASEKDIWAGIGLIGSSLDAYSVVAKLYPKLENFSYSIGGVRKVIKIAPVIALISSTIDTVMATRDAYNSTNFGQQAGHTIRAVGAALTIGGAAAAKTGVGVVVAIIGLGLQAIGSGIASQFSDLKQFLRHSKWGDESTLDDIGDWFSDKNNFGFKGDLEKLRHDIDAQHRALDWMFWVFKPDLDHYNGAALYVPSRITLKMNPPKGLGPEAQWSVKLDILSRSTGVSIKKYEWQAADAFDHAYLSSNDDIAILQKRNEPPTGQATISAYYGKVKVKGEIKLDVFGDGKNYVVREIDENLDLSF